MHAASGRVAIYRQCRIEDVSALEHPFNSIVTLSGSVNAARRQTNAVVANF